MGVPRLPQNRNCLVRLRPRWETTYAGQGRTVLATANNGFISAVPGQGLFANETRLLSHYEYGIDGVPLHPVALSPVEQHTWLGYYITLPPGFDPGPPDEGSGHVTASSQNSLELRLSRYVSGGVHEDVDLTNYTQRPNSFRLRLSIDADFAGTGETLGERQQHGCRTRSWEGDTLSFRYAAQHEYANQSERGTATFQAGIDVHIARADSSPEPDSNALKFCIHLPPGGSWHACIHLIPIIEGQRFEPEHRACAFVDEADQSDRSRKVFADNATSFITPGDGTLSHTVARTLNQARADLSALRLHDLDKGERAWTVAAGLPIYLALFGRDTLTAAWQAALLSTDLLRGTLPEIARRQGKEVNDWRDEQPGRMLHEAHTDPPSILNYTPRQRYYGATTTSSFFPVALSLLWHWTGDKALVAPLVEPAIKALRWLDGYGDLNGDGFYDYKSRSEKGTQNQGWKDSGDAIVYRDGSQVQAPIAICEEQGFAYAAKLHLSEVLWWLGRKDEAKLLYHQAGELKKRFNEAFWMEEDGYFAMGLDAQSQQIRSIGSDPGHCLATGIVEDALVQRTEIV